MTHTIHFGGSHHLVPYLPRADKLALRIFRRFLGVAWNRETGEEPMSTGKTNFGLTLPNRGVVIGATTVKEMLQMAEWADANEAWDSVWVGDSIFAKPRLDAIALLGALAARTKRVRMGPACFASTPLRDPLILAYQWACLDFHVGRPHYFRRVQGPARSRRRQLRAGVCHAPGRSGSRAYAEWKKRSRSCG